MTNFIFRERWLGENFWVPAQPTLGMIACICHPGVRHLERQQTGMFQSCNLKAWVFQFYRLGSLVIAENFV